MKIVNMVLFFLMEDSYADVFHPNNQGLPTNKLNKNKGGTYFWYPRENNVAGFGVNSDSVGLDCNGIPVGASSSLGVRASFQRS